MADADCTLEGVTVMEPNMAGVALSVGLAAICVLGALFMWGKSGFVAGRDGAAFTRMIVLGLAGGSSGAYYFGRVARKASKTVGELVANASGVHVAGKLVAARGDIVAGTTWRETNGATYVRLERGGLSRAIDLRVQDLDAGRKLLHALHLDATQSTSTFAVAGISAAQYRVGRWLALPLVVALVGSIFALFALLGSLHAPGPLRTLGPLLFAAGGFAAARGAANAARVVVGADGVYLRWLWQKHFIPIERIESAEVAVQPRTGWQAERLVVRLHLKGDETWDIPAWTSRRRHRRSVDETERARADMLAARINQAIEGGGGEASASAADTTLLQRGERAIGEWVSALKKLHRDAEGYRAPASALEQLWAILEDVKAKAEQRAAAAVALSPHLDDDGRKRVRIAAKAAVAPKLRIALEAAVDDDQTELESALEAVAEAESQ